MFIVFYAFWKITKLRILKKGLVFYVHLYYTIENSLDYNIVSQKRKQKSKQKRKGRMKEATKRKPNFSEKVPETTTNLY